MIDKTIFAAEWSLLEQRFDVSKGARVVDAYYEFLNGAMDTEAFLLAARSVFVSREFFPRPIDFIEVGVEDLWQRVIEAISVYEPPNFPGGRIFQELPQAAQDAIRTIGGLNSARAIWQDSPLRLRGAFMRAYTAIVASPSRLGEVKPNEPVGRLKP